MSKEITAVSLFTGAGGMDVGFEKAGIEVVCANELVSGAAETYKANHPGCKMINDDINNVIDTIAEYKEIDLVFGGPPCQGFSVAGKMDPNDNRSKLIFTFLDVVEKVKPRAFVMENVKALGELNKWKNVRERYLKRVAELKYSCHFFILNATDYGVPQKRERVFFIGVKEREFDAERFWQLITNNRVKAAPIREFLLPLGKAGSKNNPRTCVAKINFCAHPIMRKSPYAGMYFNGQGRPIDINGYANTLPASMGGNKTPFIDEDYLYGDADDNFIEIYHTGLMDGTITPVYGEAPSRLRRITIKEAARISVERQQQFISKSEMLCPVKWLKLLPQLLPHIFKNKNRECVLLAVYTFPFLMPALLLSRRHSMPPLLWLAHSAR